MAGKADGTDVALADDVARNRNCGAMVTIAREYNFPRSANPDSVAASCPYGRDFFDATAGGSVGIEKKPANHNRQVASADGRAICAGTEIGAIADGVFEFDRCYCK